MIHNLPEAERQVILSEIQRQTPEITEEPWWDEEPADRRFRAKVWAVLICGLVAFWIVAWCAIAALAD